MRRASSTWSAITRSRRLLAGRGSVGRGAVGSDQALSRAGRGVVEVGAGRERSVGIGPPAWPAAKPPLGVRCPAVRKGGASVVMAKLRSRWRWAATWDEGRAKVRPTRRACGGANPGRKLPAVADVHSAGSSELSNEAVRVLIIDDDE